MLAIETISSNIIKLFVGVGEKSSKITYQTNNPQNTFNTKARTGKILNEIKLCLCALNSGCSI